MNASPTNRANLLTGLLMLAGLAVCVMAALFVGAGAGKRVIEYHVQFADVTGLKVGNAVRVKGAIRGYVKEITLAHDRADITLALASKLRLHEGASARLRDKTFLGGRFIEVEPGDEHAAELSVGSRIQAGPLPVRLEEYSHHAEKLGPKAVDVAGQISRAVQLAKQLSPYWEQVRDLAPQARTAFDGVQRMGNQAKRIPPILERFASLEEQVPELDLESLQRLNERLQAAAPLLQALPQRHAQSEEKLRQLSEQIKQLATALKWTAEKQARLLSGLEYAIELGLLFDERLIRQLGQQQGGTAGLVAPASGMKRIRELQQNGTR